MHLVLLVGAAIWALFSPEEEPEEFKFELVPPPPAASAETSDDLPTLEEVTYDSQPVEPLPTLDDIQIEERPPIEVVVEMPEPEPTPVEVEQPLIPVEQPKPPEPKKMSWKDFMKQNPDADKEKNKRTKPVPQKPVQLKFQPNLSSVQIDSIPLAELESYSMAEQSELDGYIASFKATLQRNVKDHPFRGSKLSAVVICDITAGGHVTNIRLLQTSGDAEFDRKVVAGYRSIGIFARPPKGIALTGLRIEFLQQTGG
ncbi:TonB family protein [Pelagicoccus mobilis]|uniref:TonB family protein n=1 Tax=Pelagicoccus mobilis TaxID=415221 RepID=A0A934RYD1_9BACT|nr:TonB family protein [Pelagicoccus mobilis]MBK1877514.1 TonB family protein [Pelagicoccus mobilis]